jgi:hypothetical protein
MRRVAKTGSTRTERPAERRRKEEWPMKVTAVWPGAMGVGMVEEPAMGFWWDSRTRR